MSQSHKAVNQLIDEIENGKSMGDYTQQISPKTKEEINKLGATRYSITASEEGKDGRLEFLKQKGITFDAVTGETDYPAVESMKGNIENFIGMAQIPIGLAGPMLVNGLNASGDFYVPLATTEGALVASYNRGMKACRASGGATSVCLVEGVQRCPFFKFDNIGTVGLFLKWVHDRLYQFRAIVEQTSRHAKLSELNTNIEGNSVILIFEYTTGDASGQNMITICTDKICKYILSNCPVKPVEWYIESNYSGDKKATAVSFSNVRGKKVVAEVVIPRQVVEKTLRTTPEAIVQYGKASTLGVVQSGAIGSQGHVANGLTALFIACGQDVACISESSVGITRMEINADNDLYASVTLPSLIVGTVGGGTGLPTQKESLEMLGCAGAGKAKKFAEVCAAVALAGEISIAAAMSADHFTSAHQNLGRKK